FMALMNMVDRKRGAERAAGIAGGRLDPNIAKAAFAQHLAVGDAIERDAAGKTQVLQAGLGRETPGKPQDRILQDYLYGCGDVHVLLLEPALGIARRPVEQRVEALVGHGEAGAIVEILEIEPKRAVGLEIDQVVANDLLVFRRSIGRKPHQLVFARIDLEAGVIGEGGVEQPEAVREMDLLMDREVLSIADGDRRGRPLAHAIEGEDDRSVERRRIEGRGGVAQVVLAEGEAMVRIEVRLDGLELASEQRLLEQFLTQPQRQRHAKRRETVRAVGKVGFQETFELDEWLVVEDDAVDVLQLDAARAQAIVDRVPRVAGIEFLAREALLLGGGNDAAVLDERSGTVMVECRDAEDAHLRSFRKSCR